MYAKSLILLALAGAAVSRDITVGTTKHGVKVFDENRNANPALWIRVEEISISVNETDVISGLVIKDARPDKDGEARIVSGGVGQQNITIELRSPTILRGFDFHVEVYAVSKDEYVPELADNSTETTDLPVDKVTTSTDSTPKTNEDKESNATTSGADISSTVTPAGKEVDVPVSEEDKEQTRQNREITTAKPEFTPTTLETQVTDEATSTTPATEEQKSSSTTVGSGKEEPTLRVSAHGAQISGFRPEFVRAYPSHPMAIATDEQTTVKSLHKREAISEHLVNPLEVEDSEEQVLSEEEDNDYEEDEKIEPAVPKILLYKTDKLPVPYVL